MNIYGKRCPWRSMILLLVLCVFQSGIIIPAAASGDSETMTVELEDSEDGIYWKDTLQTTVSVRQTGNAPADYVLEYYLDGQLKKTYSFTLSPNITRPVFQTIENCAKGIAVLQILLKEDDQTACRYEKKVAFTDPAEHQFMETTALKGFSTSYGLENGMNDKTTRLLKAMGGRAIRDELSWFKVEREKGIYSSERGDRFIPPFVSDTGNQMVLALTYNNDLYSGRAGTADSTKYGVCTKEEMDGFARYAAFVAQSYPQVRYFEIWNEPNGENTGFWKPTQSVEDYTYLMQTVYHAIKEVRPDAFVFGGALAGGDTNFVKGIIKQHGYSFMDGISFHTYIYPSSTGTLLEEKYDAFLDSLNDLGGWKPVALTEIGWTTCTGDKGCSEEVQAAELVKQYVIGDRKHFLASFVYNFRNAGTVASNKEHNFGVVDHNGVPKPSYFSVKEHLQRLGGARYVGKAQTEGQTQLHLYFKEGETVGVLWGAGETLKFAGEQVSIYDMYGNPVGSGNEITASDQPVYVYGLSDVWMLKAAGRELSQGLEKTALLREERQTLIELAEQVSLIKEPVLAVYDKITELGEILIERHRLGQDGLTDEAFYGSLYQLALCGLRWLSIYPEASGADREVNAPVQRAEVLKELCEQKEKESGYGRFQYSRAMLSVAEEYLDRARRTAEDPVPSAYRGGCVRMLELFADCVLSWTACSLEQEIPKNDQLLLIAPKGSRLYVSGINYYKVSTYNHSDRDFTGKIKIWPVSGSEPEEGTVVTVNAHTDKESIVTFTADKDSRTYRFALFDEAGTLITWRDVFFFASGAAQNAPPAASGVEITGKPETGETLAGEYLYHGSREEAQSRLQWLISEDDTLYYEVEEEITSTMLVREDYRNQFIKFRVTPADGEQIGQAWESEPVCIGGYAAFAPVRRNESVQFYLYAKEDTAARICAARYDTDGVLLEVQEWKQNLVSGKNYCKAKLSPGGIIKIMLFREGTGLEPLCRPAVLNE